MKGIPLDELLEMAGQAVGVGGKEFTLIGVDAESGLMTLLQDGDPEFCFALAEFAERVGRPGAKASVPVDATVTAAPKKPRAKAAPKAVEAKAPKAASAATATRLDFMRWRQERGE